MFRAGGNMTKVQYTLSKINSNLRSRVEFEIVGVISKEQFKNLMNYSEYNRFSKKGEAVFDSVEKGEKFCAYIDQINQDSTEYKIEYKKKSDKKKKISFAEYCEDYLDQDPILMSQDDKKEAYKTWSKL